MNEQAKGEERNLRSLPEQDGLLPAVPSLYPEAEAWESLPAPAASPGGGGQASVCCPGGCSRGTHFR